MSCIVSECGRPQKWRHLCDTHYYRWLKTGVAGGPIQRKGPVGAGHLHSLGYVIRSVNGEKRRAHVLVAEAALGKPLPSGAEVHHIDEDKTNNSPSNLVVCPDGAYHALLHQRQRAFNACGHYDWRKCHHCKQYDDPANDMWVSSKKAHHRACDAAHKRQLKRTT